MYADRMTDSMNQAIDETNRRREMQVAYNAEHGIDPTPLRKKIADITDLLAREDADTEELLSASQRKGGRRKSPVMRSDERTSRDHSGLPAADLAALVQELNDQMNGAAADLQFEVAARIRDEISDLKKELRQMLEATK